jgi:hypothetical protein
VIRYNVGSDDYCLRLFIVWLWCLSPMGETFSQEVSKCSIRTSLVMAQLCSGAGPARLALGSVLQLDRNGSCRLLMMGPWRQEILSFQGLIGCQLRRSCKGSGGPVFSVVSTKMNRIMLAFGALVVIGRHSLDCDQGSLRLMVTRCCFVAERLGWLRS